jgi:hypothetical protein
MGAARWRIGAVAMLPTHRWPKGADPPPDMACTASGGSAGFFDDEIVARSAAARPVSQQAEAQRITRPGGQDLAQQATARSSLVSRDGTA